MNNIIDYVCFGKKWDNHIDEVYRMVNIKFKNICQNNVHDIYDIYDMYNMLINLIYKIELIDMEIKSKETAQYKKKILSLKNNVFKDHNFIQIIQIAYKKTPNIFLTSIINNFAHKISVDQKTLKLEHIISSLYEILKSDINKFSFIYQVHYDTINKVIIPESYSLVDNDNMVNLNINMDNYSYINSMIYSQKSRHELQVNYYKINDNIMRNFTKLVILRHHLSKKYGYSSYGKYILDGSNTDLKYVELTLKNIIDKLIPNMKIYLDIILKDMSVQNLSESDINYWFFNKKKMLLFSPEKIIKYSIYVLKTYFKIIFTKTGDTTYDVHNANNTKIGTVYIDLNSTSGGPKYPIVYPLDKNQTVCQFILIAGYNSMDRNILSLDDSVYLFQQFGLIVHHLLQGKPHIYNVNMENYNFMNYFMEHIFWNKKILSYIVKDNYLLSYITEIHKMEIIKNMFFNSIDALFDILIHNSNYFVDVCRELAKDEKNLHTHINKLYFNLFDSLIYPLKNIFTYDKIHFNPNILMKVINGDACIMYSSVFNIFISYNIFQSLDDNNLWNIFIDTLETSDTYLDKLINTFCRHNNIDQYDFGKFLNGNKLNDKFIKSFF